MSKQLAHEDGRAVDLLLNHGADATASGLTVLALATQGVSPSSRPAGNLPAASASTPDVDGTNMGSGFQMRLKNAEHVLSLLSELPASEPSADLLSRTLRRIEESGVARHAGDVATAVTQPTRVSNLGERPHA